MNDFTLDIKCFDLEIAKSVEAGIRIGGSGVYHQLDDLTFRVKMNPQHAPALCAICLNMAHHCSPIPEPVSFWHDGMRFQSIIQLAKFATKQ